MKIGIFDVKIIKKLEQKRKSYPLCDKYGNLIKVEYNKGKKEFKNQDGTLITETYRLINGKPMAKFKKTEVVKNFEEVDRVEVYDLRVEEYYYCECEPLKQYLKEKDKALKFIYTNGNGFKAYEGYLMVYKNELLLVLGFGSLTELINQAKVERQENKEEIKEEVERANPEELLVDVMCKKRIKENDAL